MRDDDFPALVWYVEAASGAHSFNRTWETFSGLTETDLSGDRWLKIVHPEDREALAFLRDPSPDQAPSSFDIRIRDRDGRHHWFLVNGGGSTGSSRRALVALPIEERKAAESARARELADAHAMLENTPTMMWRTTAAGDLDYANDRYLKAWHQTSDRIKGWGWKDLVHPDDRQGIASYWANHITSDSDGMYEFRAGTPESGYRWYLSVCTAQRDENGNVLKWYGATFDIEARKQAEQQLRRAGHNLQATIDTIPAIVASYLPNGSQDFANRTWQEYVGISREDAKHTDWSTIVPPDETEASQREWSDCVASGRPFQMELRILRADGEYRWHLVRRVPLRDEHGEVIKWYSVGFDIEDQKRAEAALRRSEAYSAEAQRLSQTGSFGLRISDGEAKWSKEAYRILGYDQTVKPSVDLCLARVHPDDLQMVQHQLDRVRQGERDLDFEHRVLLPEGQVKELRVRAQRVTLGAGSKEIAGAVMDITETKRAHQALQAAQAELAHATRVTTLGELTASIAHEVNQPLAGIVISGEASLRWLTRDIPQVEEARRAIERIIREAKRASGIVSRIRALSKKAAPEMMRLDINDIISDVMLLVHREVLSHRVALRLELAPGLPAVLADRIQLQQVVINLAINGIEAMDEVAEQQRRLAVRSRAADGQVLVAVQDAGTGIDLENADQLFSAFCTTKANGMGMGLSISRSIIEAHQGRIWATNNDGPGATIQFTLPIAPDSQP